MLFKKNRLLGVFQSAILPPHLDLRVFASSIVSLCYHANETLQMSEMQQHLFCH